MIDLLAGVGANISIGLSTALSATNLFYCFVGVFLGMLVGVLPGVGALAAMSLLFPLTFYLDATTALIMLAGIWYGTGYGGSTAAILLNVPGTTSSAIACLDGYPMAQQGRAGVALLMTTVGSFVGGSIGIILMMLFSPILVEYALSFGSAEYFSLILLGLVSASTISAGSPIKSMAMIAVGLVLGTVGLDLYTGASRFTFGVLELSDGISLVALAMGLFGVAEVIASLQSTVSKQIDRKSITFRSMIPTRDDWRRSWAPTLRGTGVGSFFGALPGTGPAVASFMAYALEKKIAREPERFGKGAIEGLVSSESANNAADQTAFIPTMALGIPGSATMAIMIGALMIHGLSPGPGLVTGRPDLFWGLVMSFWIGNLILVILNIPLIGLWTRVLLIPYRLLYPAILMFVCMGIYSVNNSTFDVWVALLLGALGFLLRLGGLPATSLLLGFVLGPMMEEHFRRALIISHGDFGIFVYRPISRTILLVTMAALLWAIWNAFRTGQVTVVEND